MKKTLIFFTATILLALALVPHAYSHCEIPCGIYGDEIRFYILEEHITTIEKSMQMIKKLSGAEEIDYNQLVRWIDNKETHAQYFQDILCQYFLTQRLKPVSEDDDEQYQMYLSKLTRLHKLQVLAMKTKQTTDLELVKEMRALLASFRGVYFDAEPGAHRPPKERRDK
jgi:nickel superoxide dismutase